MLPVNPDALQSLLEFIILSHLDRQPASRSELEQHIYHGLRRIAELRFRQLNAALGRLKLAGFVALDARRETYSVTLSGKQFLNADRQKRQSAITEFIELDEWRRFTLLKPDSLN